MRSWLKLAQWGAWHKVNSKCLLVLWILQFLSAQFSRPPQIYVLVSCFYTLNSYFGCLWKILESTEKASKVYLLVTKQTDQWFQNTLEKSLWGKVYLGWIEDDLRGVHPGVFPEPFSCSRDGGSSWLVSSTAHLITEIPLSCHLCLPKEAALVTHTEWPGRQGCWEVVHDMLFLEVETSGPFTHPFRF